jgi:hypothetical protein
VKPDFLKFIYAGIVGLTLAGLNLCVQAAPPPINGSISFFGTPVLNGSLASATAFTGFPHIVVLNGSESGVYTNLPDGTAASWTPFTFNPPATSVIPLWAITNGGVIYSFDATSVALTVQNSSVLSAQGTGIAHVTGFADTPGTWSFLVNPGPSFLAPISVSMTNVPVLQDVTHTNGTIAFAWNALPGQPYQVEYTTNLASTNWNGLGGAITTTNSTATTSDTIGPGAQRFYRVWLLP